VLSSAYFRIPTIRSTEKRFVFMANLSFALLDIRQNAIINHWAIFLGRFRT
jgi:hypothetical protein